MNPAFLFCPKIFLMYDTSILEITLVNSFNVFYILYKKTTSGGLIKITA